MKWVSSTNICGRGEVKKLSPLTFTVDLQANIARDKYARLCTQVESLVGSLKITQADDILAEIADQLVRASSYVHRHNFLTIDSWKSLWSHRISRA
jgi:hypothetical protein